VVVAVALALWTNTGRAQDAPTAVAPAAPAPAASLEERVDQLARELEAQKAQREAERRAAEAEKAALEERLQKVEAQAAEAQAQGEMAGLMAGAEEELVEEPLVRVYGFADVGLQRTWGPIANAAPSGPSKTTFVLGNVNLYFDANPVQDWRFLSEVRFGLFPHGATDRSTNGVAPPINTTVGDDSSPSGGFTTINWNGVILERAHIDWEPSDQLSLRAGLFLTPFGIYNVDHGSPTRISLEAPLMITTEMFPTRQVGLEAFGRFQALPWTLGYHLYVSNGRQPGQLDYADDKAIGTRLWAQTRRPIPMTFGVSGYTGRYEFVEKLYSLEPGGGFHVEENESVAYREHAIAADASVDIDELRLRTEGFLRWRLFEAGKRTSTLPGTEDADVLYGGAYALAAYRLPWLGLEPLVQFDLLRVSTAFGEYFARSSVGLNIYFDPAVVLRLNYFYTRSFDLKGPSRELNHDNFNAVASRLSIAF
jgi:hypothetical protein